MIELIVLKYLIKKGIEGIDDNVFLEVPEKPPARYILIEKTGSARGNLINTATIAVQSISIHSLWEAMLTNEKVKEALSEFVYQSPDVYSCKLDTDYNFTNTRTKEYRYQAVFDLTY